MTSALFVVHDNEIVNLNSGNAYQLPPAIAQHAIRSMRLEEGDEFNLSDGCGIKLTVSLIDKKESIVRIVSREFIDPPQIRLGLVQALAKSGRDEQAIEMATEIGVDSIIPWQAHRSIVQWKGNKVQKALTKWSDVVTAATEQSRRSFVPNVLPVMTTKQLNAWIKESVDKLDTVIVLHQDATGSWAQIEDDLSKAAVNTTVWVVVGPEGGISDEEIQLFKDSGAQVCVIGHNILRASSAGSVALTLISRVIGRYDV